MSIREVRKREERSEAKSYDSVCVLNIDVVENGLKVISVQFRIIAFYCCF